MASSRRAWNTLRTEGEREQWLEALPQSEQRVEWLKCKRSPLYFIYEYVSIYDKVAKTWIPFKLWDCQMWVLEDLHTYSKNLALKARQEGFSWLALAYNGLYRMLFHAIAKIGVFSKRDDEAVYMLGKERLQGMYERLPPFLQAQRVTKADGHTFGLSNGSVARAFPTTGGDAYAMTDVILDEFDLVPDQNALMRAVKPTIDGGGNMTIVSRVDKDRPRSEFKRMFCGASTMATIERDPEKPGELSIRREEREDGNGWNAFFVPWYAHPDRDEAWYAREEAETLDRTGSRDDLWEQYPATPEQALAARTLSKRISPEWLAKCYEKRDPLEDLDSAPAIPGLEVYAPPVTGRRYVVGLDPAEGNPTSDDSAIEVVDRDTGEEVCVLAGKYEPALAAFYAHRLAQWYNNAPVMIERNNHGHACILWFRDNSRLKLLVGEDRKPGWLDNSRGKAMLYADGAELIHDRRALIHSQATHDQIASIEGSSLRAPEGEHDDRATAYMLALLGCKRPAKQKKAKSYQG